ncbi:nucleoside-diphosphate sugar epimerase/dehydratase [Streptococcus iniae]
MFFLDSFSRRFIFLAYIFSSFLVSAPRITWRLWHEFNLSKYEKGKKEKKRILVVGAGEGGSTFIQTVLNKGKDIEIVGIVDSDINKLGTYLHGIKVMGNKYLSQDWLLNMKLIK